MRRSDKETEFSTAREKKSFGKISFLWTSAKKKWKLNGKRKGKRPLQRKKKE
ncbi:Protein CBG27475 [Caenorhabditis briggsae]|uniref:Protein CBG27475 n=1 Tax=Caenorhabditis briggsae TaxID=6238 RepID=B6IEZ1_CAEBR|nr:Protein CBG27475 [Caenorhabditis briggsae]CAR98471.1 Protein CBG27475 [Caenorhabditis briggsae]